MAFFASQLSLQLGFQNILNIAQQQKSYLGVWNTRLASDITALDAVEIVSSVTRAVSAMDTTAALPGLTEYARTQFANPAYNVAAEYTSMKNALVAISTWIKSNIPANSITISNGVPVGATFAPAATAPLKALVVAAMATIA